MKLLNKNLSLFLKTKSVPTKRKPECVCAHTVENKEIWFLFLNFKRFYELKFFFFFFFAINLLWSVPHFSSPSPPPVYHQMLLSDKCYCSAGTLALLGSYGTEKFCGNISLWYVLLNTWNIVSRVTDECQGTEASRVIFGVKKLKWQARFGNP